MKLLVRSAPLLVLCLLAGCATSSSSRSDRNVPEGASIAKANPEAATNGTIRIRIGTNKGDIEAEIFADKTPVTAANFLNLARRGYYDGLAFHRVIPNFMIQGGDPLGSGYGGPGYTFEDEFHPELRHSGAGVLSMANSGPGTNGSQFFITHTSTPWLDDKHTVFGRVTKGQKVVNDIRQYDLITRIEILDSTDVLFASQAARIEAWNRQLDLQRR